jgi:dienelactone hydrolase
VKPSSRSNAGSALLVPLCFCLCVACSARSGVAGPAGAGGTSPDAGAGEVNIDCDAGYGDALVAVDVGAHDASVEASPSSEGPYGAPGPFSVASITDEVARTATPFTVTVYLPLGSGPFPVVILSSGFFQPGAAYAPYADRLASWGIAAILRDDPALSEDAADLASDLAYEVTAWIPAHRSSTCGPLGDKLDATRVGLAGHSRGGQASFLAAEGGARGRIAGICGLDPVDGTPAAIPNAGQVDVPTAFIGETTDGSGTMPCAPTAQNYQAFYASVPSPSVSITALGADHTMFEDPAACVACSLCAAGTADPTTVLRYAVRYLTAFFARLLLGQASVGVEFQGAGLPLDTAAGLVIWTSK